MTNPGEIGEIENKTQIEWRIPDFFLLAEEKKGCDFNSPVFSFAEASLHFVLIPKSKKYPEFMNLYLRYEMQTEYSVEYNFGLKKLDGSILHLGSRIVNGCKTYSAGCKTIKFSELLQRKSELAPDNVVTIICTMNCVHTDAITHSSQPSELDETKPLKLTSSDTEDEEDEIETATVEGSSEDLKNGMELKGADRLVQNLNNLLENEWGSDVILKNSDHEFRAHMAILVARSPVFASMFQHDMIEKRTGEVDISDCSTAGFQVFLQFLYTGSANKMTTANVFDSYYIADKYQIDDLKGDCVEFMKNTLSAETFCDVITLSLRHGESGLQTAATRFFCKNIKEIIKTVKWQTYITENPIHANELMIKAVNA